MILPQVNSLEEARVHIASLSARLHTVEVGLRQLEKSVETLWTPPWKKLWFWIDGWPLYEVTDRRRPRPWHK